ncbi:MAG: hypothetical protein ABIU95_10800, partial [Burkholderiales bacterium]
FRDLYTIEIHPPLFERAKRRFNGQSHVHPILGDSATTMPEVLATIPTDAPTMLWLDGHYSGELTGKGATDCPVIDELERIAARRLERVKIVIDDVRYFGMDAAYPSLAELHNVVQRLFPGAVVRIENDMAVIDVLAGPILR